MDSCTSGALAVLVTAFTLKTSKPSTRRRLRYCRAGLTPDPPPPETFIRHHLCNAATSRWLLCVPQADVAFPGGKKTKANAGEALKTVAKKAGYKAAYGCEEGKCGTCEHKVRQNICFLGGRLCVSYDPCPRLCWGSLVHFLRQEQYTRSPWPVAAYIRFEMCLSPINISNDRSRFHANTFRLFPLVYFRMRGGCPKAR